MKIINQKNIVILTSCLFLISCKTVNFDSKDQIVKESKTSVEESIVSPLIEVQKETVYIEKPIYIPEAEKAVKDEKLIGVESVKNSTEKGTILPEDSNYAARIYDYNPDQVYEVYCQVLRTTDIYLQPGEVVIDSPFISDSERWILGAGVHQQGSDVVQHIYIKPKTAGLEATLIINTTSRVYHLLLRSYNTVHMPMVKFRYDYKGLPQVYAKDIIKKEFNSEMTALDPSYLSFNYKMTYSTLFKPAWMPERVYDDGKKTYIVFDLQVLQRELPGVFENKNDIVNYRVQENIIIIDKLVEKITIKYNKKKITIEKKKG